MNKLHSIFIAFFLIFISLVHGEEETNNQINHELLAKFEEINPGQVLEYLIAREKLYLAEFIITLLKNTEKKEVIKADKDGHFFEPQSPQSSKDLEKYKDQDPKKTIYARISEKYMGELDDVILDIIYYFSNHDQAKKMPIYNRLLLHGPPGTGKSHLVKVLADELEIPLLSFPAASFSDKYIGESSRKIRKAFETAVKLNKPVFIFIDEIDALAVQRTDSTHQEHRATLTTLLTEMQALHNNRNVFVFAATNNLEVLDPAVKDRFAGSVCEIKALDQKNKAKFINKTFADVGLPADEKLATRLSKVFTDNYSNRDIQYVITSAQIKKARDGATNPKNSKKHLCTYLRKAMDKSGKQGQFGIYSGGTQYCDGI